MASAPHEESILFFIKNVGDWTGELHKLCKAGLHPKTREPVHSFEVKVRGPYGAPAQHVGQYEKILLISGGVGATPFCSVTKEINEAVARNFFRRAREDNVIDISSRFSWRSDNSTSEGAEEEPRGPDIQDAGRTVLNGIKRPRRHPRPYLADIKKTPHMIRSRDHEDYSIIPTQTRSQFLYTLVSTSMFNTAMLWLLLIRLSVSLLAVAFSMVDFAGEGTDVFRSLCFTWVDVVLSGIFFVMLLFAIIAELASEKRAIVEEWFVLLPLACLPFVFHSMALAGKGTGIGHIASFEFYVGWPILVMTFLFRYFRIVGRRALLSDTVRKSYQTTKSVDFIWTAKTRDDDMWLIEELSKTVGNSSFVRLHRFITREQNPERNQKKSLPRSPGSFHGELVFRDNYGRPNWQQIFKTFTSKMRNGTTAGIFFCGPPKMAAEVKQAATMAMFDSRYRSISTAQEPTDVARMQSLLFSQGSGPTIPDSLTRSFNVRYVFREERF
ncbi:Ferric reductase [Gracilaria domingensis]|nr:Ferric reductase [Gracilaria domingensis]